ncbi:hypothetical protein TNCV_3836561 [Trichonephila clavipes]|nr:hypothetical protein TNCV_3836561 [Trichonephila clavipes]
MSWLKRPPFGVVWKLGEKGASSGAVHLTMVPNYEKAVGTLVVRASDSRLEGLGSMPDATKYPPSTHGVRVR